jgi:hypothetical protein
MCLMTQSSHLHPGFIILILQDLAVEVLKEVFDHIDEVVNQKGYSSVILDDDDRLLVT